MVVLGDECVMINHIYPCVKLDSNLDDGKRLTETVSPMLSFQNRRHHQ